MEKETIKQINMKLNSIGITDDVFKLKTLVNELIDLVRMLGKQTNDVKLKQYCIQSTRALTHTRDKEVSYADEDYRRTRKKNAAKVRINEYHKTLNRAVSHINDDVNMVVNYYL